jgi:hypothetical protein
MSISPRSYQYPKRSSPLAPSWVAQGFHYDINTGLVAAAKSHPSPNPPASSPQPPAVSQNTSVCVDGVGQYEVICPDGVKVLAKPSQPER